MSEDLKILVHGAIQQYPKMGVEEIVNVICNLIPDENAVNYELADYDNIELFREVG